MKTSSAKQKGRKFQQWVRDAILSLFPHLEDDDVRSTSMGASGEDIQLSPAARKAFPYQVECKNQERLNFWSAWEQATGSGEYMPLLFIKRNHTKPIVCMDAEHFFTLLERPEEEVSTSSTSLTKEELDTWFKILDKLPKEN